MSKPRWDPRSERVSPSTELSSTFSNLYFQIHKNPCFSESPQISLYEYLLIYFLNSAGERQINLVLSLNNSLSTRQDVI